MRIYATYLFSLFVCHSKTNAKGREEEERRELINLTYKFV